MPKNKRIQSYQDRDACAASRGPFQTRGMLIGKCMTSLFCQLMFIAIMSTNAWTATVGLSVVDSLGEDTVFNGTTQKLRITFQVTGIPLQDPEEFDYTVESGGGEINSGKIGLNALKSYDWDGSGVADGSHTILVSITGPRHFEPHIIVKASAQASATLDRTPPQISISTDALAFSPNGDGVLDALNVYYNINENVAKSELEILRVIGTSADAIGNRIQLRRSSDSHTYRWFVGHRNTPLLPDGIYRLRLQVTDKAGNSPPNPVETGNITIDTEAPRIPSTGIVIVTETGESVLTDGIFVNQAIRAIKVTPDKGASIGTDINFDADAAQVILKKEGTDVKGTLGNDGEGFTFVLSDRLNTESENGTYTLTVTVADKAGNSVQQTLSFIFDNVVPTLTEVATSNGALTAERGVSKWINYVEATLTDNLKNGLSLPDSTIRLTGPDGAILGQQTQPTDDKIRWIFLTPLVAKDGINDGAYTIEIEGKDKAGNSTGVLQVPFVYDNVAPQLATFSSAADETTFDVIGDTIYQQQPLPQIIATFTDGDAGIGVDIEQAKVEFSKGNTALPGRVFPDENNNSIAFILDEPLISRDGSQDGIYTLKVTVADRLGNTESEDFQLIYDTQIPTLVSTVPASNETVSTLTQVQVNLKEATSGIDFVQSTFRLTHNDTEVPINVTSNGTENATLTVLAPFAVDGSDDGPYVIEVTPRDRAGNQGATARREFYLVSQTQTKIRLTAPETTTLNTLPSVSVELQDYIGGGINFDASSVVVKGPDGAPVAQSKQDVDKANYRLTWSTETVLPPDGAADGQYAITAVFVDFTGAQWTEDFTFTVDTQPPGIANVQAMTVTPTPLEVVQVPVIDEEFAGITLVLDSTDVDVNNTEVTLTSPSGSEMPLNVSLQADAAADGATLLVNFSELTRTGQWTLSITPRDYLGNASTRPFVYKFRIEFVGVPSVSSVLIDGKVGSLVYLNGGATRIVATFTDATGAGIAFEPGNDEAGALTDVSTITVTNEAGTTVPGTVTPRGANQLEWQAIAPPTNSTADGRYTVTVTPIDKLGRQGEVARRQFIYDTQPPQLTAASPISLTAPVTYVTAGFASDTEFSFTVADVGPAGVEMSEQTAQLLGADGTALSAVVTRNQTDRLFLTLTEPLAMDGSADGSYAVTVSLVDRAGNATQADYAVVYDTQVPAVSGVTLNTAEPTILVATQTAVITELGFSELEIGFEEATTRVDFANTTVTVTGPDNEMLPLTFTPKGTTQLTAAFVAPQALGVYTLSITPQDIAGNTARGAVTYRFRLDVDVPRVTSVVIDGQVGGVAYINGVNGAATRIVATLADPSGAGLALGEGGSTITVANAGGTLVPGTTTDNGADELTWVSGVLPLDGTADGRYTVTITPLDKAGRQGAAVSRQFVFDTQPPRVTEAVPINLNQPHTYLNASFAQNPQVQFTVADVGPAALALDEQTALFREGDAEAEGHALAATVTHDDTEQLFLTLAEPLPIDGSADGTYTVTLTLVDRAGNETQADYAVVYDTQLPAVSGVTLNTAEPTVLVATQTTVISVLGFSELEIAFEEATTRVDFANTALTLTGPDDAALSLTLVPDGDATLLARFVAPQALGVYTLSITPQDIAGNTARGAVNYRFRLDVELPRVTSVVIDGKAVGVAYINGVNGAATRIVAKLADPSGAGLALGEGGSTITVANAGGTPVPGTTTDNGDDELTWVPSVLPLDGTADGRYTVTITPRDKAGRQGDAVYRQFVFDTQPPEITDASPMDMSQPVTYLSELSQMSVTLADVGPAEFWVEEQGMTLLDAAGSEVPTSLTHNEEDRLFLTLPQPLAKDGSQDGEYTVSITLIDKSGNRFETSHTLVYDTQAPQLVSTAPADGDILTDDVSQVQAVLEDAGGSGIDFAATTLTLVAPGGTSITGALSNDGESELTLNLNPLVEDGRYRIRVEARDRAGNGDELRFERSFLLSRTLPSVVSTQPVTAPAEDAFTNQKISQIEVELESADAKTDEKHLSTLRLLGPGASVIPGQQQREASRLTYTLARPLAQDGSEDGIYTIEFTPISPSGRSGDVQRLTFTYDTEAPELENEDIQLVVSESGVNNSLTEIRVKLTDNQSGIDWENLDDDWFSFERISPNAPNGETIAGKVEDATQDTLRFRLTTPLADDGSNDGEYRITVSPKDRAGNTSEPYEKGFTYDTAPPVIDDSTLLINSAPLLVDANALDYPTAISTTGGVVIQANMFDNGLGVNLAQSQIVVSAPGGERLSGTTQQNGIDTLVFKSAGLTTRGLYQVTVTSVGNDSEFLGFAPQDSLTTEFLYEITAPTATLTSDGGEKELTDEALPLEGTATDPSGTQRIGEREQQVPASGVWLVEIVGTGPDGQPIEPVPAIDDSNVEEEPWSRWALDFLPSRSGEYELGVRVTDNAGNYEVYDIGKYTMSVSLTFRGSTFGWPNPLRISKGDVAFFSFDVNVPMGDTVELTLSIYDWSGDMVLSQTYPDVVSGIRNDQLLKWNLRNQAGNPVARGIYIFRLEAVNATGNRANVVGKVLVVD